MTNINPNSFQPISRANNGVPPTGQPISLSGSGEGEKPESFGNMLSKVLASTNDQMVNADTQSRAMLAGESKNIHEVMIALEKANISFRFINQVRNKAVEAYQEVFRMQL